MNNNIYRFMSIYEFYELYINKKLKLTKMDLQVDINDGIEKLLGLYTTPYSQLLPHSNYLDAVRKSTYITCWTQEFDSIAMWLLYSKNEECIRVKSTKEKLETVIRNFSKEKSCWSQWDRPEENIVLIEGREQIQEVQYIPLRDKIKEIRRKKRDFRSENFRQFKSDKNYYHTNGNFKEDWIEFHKQLSDEYKFPVPIKDISYSFEKEIRGEVHAGIKVDENTKEDWEKNAQDYTKIPIKDAKDNELPLIIYASIPENFIEEICFDPRMPKYKRDVLIELFKLTDNKIVESKVFSPTIDLINQL